MVGTAIKTRRPRIALDVGAEAVRFANPLLPDTRSEIALPLVVGSRVLGALDVQSTQSGAFDESSAVVLQAMADQVAISLSNTFQFKRATLHHANSCSEAPDTDDTESTNAVCDSGKVLFGPTSASHIRYGRGFFI
jgi:GAF domain-containing protein